MKFRYLDPKLWHPKAFMRDFADCSADLVNTLTGKTVPKQPLKWFWEGFSSVTRRLVDAEGTPMLLKLKDWPPDGDIGQVFLFFYALKRPTRFQQLTISMI